MTERMTDERLTEINRFSRELRDALIEIYALKDDLQKACDLLNRWPSNVEYELVAETNAFLAEVEP